jgi:predicted RNA-binding protein with PUA-like domain
MAFWLFKEEPAHYSFADLERDRRTLWDGVTNALARQYLRAVRKGDRVFFYHSGKERAVVGEMRAAGDPRTDPANEGPKAVVVEVEAVRRLAHPVTLTRIKEEPKLAAWDLVRLPRLSVLPVSEEQWKCLEQLSLTSE